MKPHVNSYIEQTVRVFPEQGRGAYLRYDMNENPEGLPQEFVSEVLQEITPEFLATYPEPGRFERAYAKAMGCEQQNVLTTNGTDMALRYILETFGEPGKEVVTVSPTFEMYWVNCNILGYVHKPVPYDDELAIDVRDIVNAIGEDTRVVILTNPNNPVGNTYTDEEIETVLDRVREVGALLVVDEAYHYFFDGTFMPHALHDENVLVTRTFSKLFSIAACRLGVIVGMPQTVEYVRRSRLTFDVNSVALLFGERLLEHPEIAEQLIAREAEGKRFLASALEEHGYETRVCAGNYVLVAPRKDPRQLADTLAREQRVLVHPYGARHALARYLRVSTGSTDAMRLFLNRFLAADESQDAS